MRTKIIAVALCLMVATDVNAQNIKMVDQPVIGSEPYKEAVRRMLNGQEPKIVGGKPAKPGAYPWQVSLGVSWAADPYRAHFCGGSVYSASWIVTAAHCVQGTPLRDMVVSAGSNVLGAGIAVERRNIRRVIINSRYNPRTHDNDVALLELFTPLPLSATIKAVGLLAPQNEAASLQPGVGLIVTGWGATAEGGQAVRDLRYVEVPFVDRASCNRPLAYDNQVTDNMICAGIAAGGVDSCQGDSGGPLTVDTVADPKLAGVVSWGEGCARPNKPGVYTRVANYAAWITACVARPDDCR